MSGPTTRVALVAALAVAASGCSLIFAPDRDRQLRDAGPEDAGDVDSGLDAGPDSGVDGGGDGGCPGSQGIETSCSDGVDNDCNGLTDCVDFACRVSPACCTGAATPWPAMTDFNGGTWESNGTTVMRSPGRVTFGTAPTPQAAVLRACAPLAFGMDFTVRFDVDLAGPRGDYGAFLLSPTPDRAGTTPFLSELAVRVLDSGEVRLERAGALIASAQLDANTVLVSVSLRPGLDAASRPVLLATVNAGSAMLGEVEQPFMPLSDLRGAGATPSCEPDGLFVVIEGQGTKVSASSAVTAEQLACENPNQFLPETTALEPLVDQFAANTPEWRTGGLSEPAVAHYRQFVGSELLDVWADASVIERSDELLRFVDFTIGAAQRQSTGVWASRLQSGSPVLLGPSAREPSIWAPTSIDPAMGTRLTGGELLFAHALKRDSAEIYDLFVGFVSVGAPPNPALPTTPTIEQTPAECTSLRDPSVVALGSNPRNDGVLLFYTCEQAGEPDRVAVSRLSWDGSRFVRGATNLSLLTSSIGPYASRGVFSPEAAVFQESGGTVGVRLWFLTRDAAGEVAVSTALGEIPEGEALPVLSPYPGNPTLRADDPLLGADCAMGCGLDAVAVTRTLPASRWMSPSYLVVVAQSRQTVTGVEHRLVPLLQSRPNDE